MKTHEIVRKGNSNSLLTVTPSRVTIKLKAGLSCEEENRVVTFLSKVAEKLADEPNSMRGALQDTWRITMKSNNGQVSHTFSEV